MLTVLSQFLESIPPIGKEIILIVIAVILLMAAWKGGSARDKFFSLAK